MAGNEEEACGLDRKKLEDYEMAMHILSSMRPWRIHALGITGVGMSGLAFQLKAQGHDVSGCDKIPNQELAKWLESNAITVCNGHSASHIDAKKTELLICSPAVRDNTPELLRAKELNIPVICRGATLAALATTRPTVAVAGTHGKTTTATFTATALRNAGHEISWCIGGVSKNLPIAGTAQSNPEIAPFVIEADESDGTLALYKPAFAILTSVERDHMEHFRDFDELRACFRKMLRNTTHGIIFSADDENAGRLVEEALDGRGDDRVVLSYGFSEKASLRAVSPRLFHDSSRITLLFNGENCGELTISAPGRHNIQNALAAVAAVILHGHDPRDAINAMSSGVSLPNRRFQLKHASAGFDAISDYAHHPTELAALISAAQLRTPKRLVVLFQPHRYTRTKALLSAFPPAFANVDLLVLLPVYAASEDPIPGGKTEDLYREFRNQSKQNPEIPTPLLIQDLDAATAWLRTGLRQGDLVIVAGAGDITRVYSQLDVAAPTHTATELPKRVAAAAQHAIRPRTTFNVGGTADCFVRITDEDMLLETLDYAKSAQAELRVIGGGSNLIIRDTGLRGITIRLDDANFSQIERTDETYLRIGTALNGSLLLSTLSELGLSGLEYMAGIPGTVGGWLAMNAGTKDGSFGENVSEIEAFDKNGHKVTINGAQAGFEYRHTRALADKIAVSTLIRLKRDSKEKIKARLADAMSKRFDFRGLRTAGSVFRNMPDCSAGLLLDQANCKGLSVGNASVCPRHANIITVQDGATASDIIALSQLMRDRVWQKFNIDLKMEIKIW